MHQVGCLQLEPHTIECGDLYEAGRSGDNINVTPGGPKMNLVTRRVYQPMADGSLCRVSSSTLLANGGEEMESGGIGTTSPRR